MLEISSWGTPKDLSSFCQRAENSLKVETECVVTCDYESRNCMAL